MKKVVYAFLFVISTFGISGATTEQNGDTDAVLEQIQKSASVVTTLKSDFVQDKHLAIFKESIVSKGRFYFQRENRLRWELLQPVSSGFIMDGRKGRRWNGRSGRSESFDISREPGMKIVADQLIAWTVGNFKGMRQEYDIAVVSENPVTLTLKPLSKDAAKFLDHVMVVFSDDKRCVTVVEVHERDGDYTRIRFSNTLVNAPLKKELFE